MVTHLTKGRRLGVCSNWLLHTCHMFSLLHTELAHIWLNWLRGTVVNKMLYCLGAWWVSRVVSGDVSFELVLAVLALRMWSEKKKKKDGNVSSVQVSVSEFIIWLLLFFFFVFSPFLLQDEKRISDFDFIFFFRVFPRIIRICWLRLVEMGLNGMFHLLSLNWIYFSLVSITHCFKPPSELVFIYGLLYRNLWFRLG